jgi:hypothetical protein
MSDLVLSNRAAELVLLAPPRRRLSRGVQAEVDRPQVAGLVAASHNQAVAHVTAEAMARTSLLSTLESRLAASDPVAADRLSGFIDDYVHVARSTIRRMGTL